MSHCKYVKECKHLIQVLFDAINDIFTYLLSHLFLCLFLILAVSLFHTFL